MEYLICAKASIEIPSVFTYMHSTRLVLLTIPPCDFMRSNNHGYWGDKVVERAGFELKPELMHRPYELDKLVHLLTDCATLL